MLDTNTKRRIDTARDILVGKVPDPKSQVEQITIALIYKFMDDMDLQSEELGGQRKFFAGEFARYGWAKLMRSGLGGHETLNLYAEAITKMPENPGIPPLFRDIFKNAYLPYRDPETLRAFLKIVDEFTYDHSERLGDAFEYLLSVLGSQGGAGQFRTPRHIIDFIVEVLNPNKTDTILDPACGTAGFLISAYKYILRANSSPEGVGQKEIKNGDEAALHSSKIPPARGDLLTPDERGRLAENFKGYDISPDMVRLSLVNMYLHGFSDPHIYEYDTLTSQDRWSEHADVILANPPFMSPKGGIKPHNRFSVQSKRSEVLFVDYIAEHLTPSGRAGIIVPEGIIFQSQTAYKQLRKMLVEEYLVAVVSLPAGVFNPYSGVKTSILILDKSLARQSNTIGFFKIENDGFGLGAQRRPIEKNDLPQAYTDINDYLCRLRTRKSIENFQPALGLIVSKEKIFSNVDYNLSGERYREFGAKSHKFPLIKIDEICDTFSGGTPQSGNKLFYEGGNIPWLRSGEVSQGEIHRSEIFITEEGLKNSSAKLFPANTVLVAMYGATAGEVGILRIESATNQAICGIIPDNRLMPDFLYLLLKANKPNLIRLAGGGAQPNISQKIIREFQIPLPPLDVQKEIVAEIEGYQMVIEGAQAVIDNYRPHIPIHPDWPMVELGDITTLIRGITFSKSDQLEHAMGDSLLVVTTKAAQESGIVEDALYHIPRSMLKDDTKLLRPGDILISTANSLNLLGRTTHVRKVDQPMAFGAFMSVIRPNKQVLDGYLIHCLRTTYASSFFLRNANTTTNISNLNLSTLAHFKIPLPPLDVQKEIVAEIEIEQSMIATNRDLITRFDKKSQAVLARIWGDDKRTAVKGASDINNTSVEREKNS